MTSDLTLVDVTLGGVPFQTAPGLTALGVPHGFTTRLGGVSEGIYASLNLGGGRGDAPERVRENYRRVCQALGVPLESVVCSSQVHGDAVRTVTAADGGKGILRPVDYDADGLITDVPGFTLTVFGADCLTILLCDPVRRVIGAVHAGWRGTALGIVDRAVERMEEGYGCRAQDLRAALGPCIGMCCFETDADVPQAMTDALGPAAEPYITAEDGGKFHVDLQGLNALRLRRLGVPQAQVERSPDCTMCRPDKYWSHRYTKGARGSQAALIHLPVR